MQITQGLRRAVQVNGSRIATIDGERRRTWTEVGGRVQRLAAGLRNLGLQPGGRVAILALNSDRYLEYYFAVPWAGGVVVPLNTRWTAAEHAYALNASDAAILLVDDSFAGALDALRSQAPSVRTIIFMGDGARPADSIAYEELVES